MSAELLARRAAALPPVTYPAELPVSARRDDIAAAIAAHQVVIVAGETGSGKTTQLPKICLELGRGITGMIGHTQPRRLAARTVAQRIADELDVPLGEAVGFAVRFTDQVRDTTLIKLMTDGILLAEIQRDPQLRRYDTLILDEAHERGLNIDFLLGYLKRLLPQRPELKLIITSATIDPQRFAKHFNDAPIVEVSGRTYPVEIRYRPLGVEAADEDSTATDADDPDDPDHDQAPRPERDQVEGIVDAVRELSAPGLTGDILVFLSGEREIRDTADALNALDLYNTEVLPLYARLSTAEQHRVFAPHSTRRIVLATNVAETSLTVPGIHYVIDPGTARMSRYSHRTKVQRLPIEPISQASANQRSGRCGRIADGICIRLYSAKDFASRPEFTEPEILRTNLASVILQMAALRLGEVADFPFLDAPDPRAIRDGVALLHELGAVDDAGGLTPIGRQVSRLPVDPRIGRMIVQAGAEGCVREILTIAAALSIPDPRERPAEQAQAAAAKHARFADETSDFLSLLNLWNYLAEQRADRSGNQFRRMCREEFLHYLRIREWQDLRGQLSQLTKSLELRENSEPAAENAVHSAITAGLLSHVGLRSGEGREYTGARNSRFILAPASALARKPPQWVVAAEIVETSRLYARMVARVDPVQVEKLAGHLVQRTYSEPHWDQRRGAVMSYERVTLFGVPLVARRRVNYGSIDQPVSRELFIRHALVLGEWSTTQKFFAANTELVESLRELEERTRRRDLLVDDEDLFEYYDKRVGPEVVSVRHFDSWWKQARRERPDLLTLTREDLLRVVVDEEHPDRWQQGDVELPLSYRFEPGAEDDGVTVHIPVAVLARLGGAEFGWQVPALREELVIALIKSLPKDLRRNFVPAPDTARAVLAAMGGAGSQEPSDEPLTEVVQRELHRLRGVLVPLDAFDLSRIPAHLRLNFAVESADGQVLATGRDLGALQAELAAPARAAVASVLGADLQRSGLIDWPADLEEIPRVVEESVQGQLVRGFPGFQVAGQSVELRIFASEAERRASHLLGLRRLLRRRVSLSERALVGGLSTRSRLVLASNPDGGLDQLVEDLIEACLAGMITAPIFQRGGFDQLLARAQGELPRRAADLLKTVEKVLGEAHEVRSQLSEKVPPAAEESVLDVRQQLRELMPAGFITAVGADRVRDLQRYLAAMHRRLEQLPRDVELDRARMLRVHQVQEAYRKLLSALSPLRASEEDVRAIGWQVQELRVSLFAQQLGTPRPVSEQRIYRAIDAIVP
ncbi:ATP-dependent helicase HrpA [Frankineae bacterium MT45]|nr:ATP-dependent helicase HrpA [Frankineae bacterium MT45]